MNKLSNWLAGCSVALALAAGARVQAETNKNATEAADSAEAVAAYPLTTCVVSGEPLGGGDMGPPYNHVHQEAGKPDRLVRFCCKSCLKDFKKDPAAYLKKIDDAAKETGGNAGSGHEDRHH